MKNHRSFCSMSSRLQPRSADQKRGRRGAATVELALCLPLLGALTLGICELGQALKVEAVLSGAARFACATACRPGCSNTDVVEDAKALLTRHKISADAATVVIKVNDQVGNITTAAANTKISVTVSIPISKVNWTKTSRYFGTNAILSQTVVMARQG